jgi:cytochrome c-type biogenesis protein CcmH/NrfG
MEFHRLGLPTLLRPRFSRLAACVLALVTLGVPAALRADDLADAVQQFRHGDYAGAQAAAEKVTKEPGASENWWGLEAECLLVQGRYEDAHKALVDAIASQPNSLRLQLLDYQADLYTGRETEAAQILDGFNSVRAQLTARQQYAQTPVDPNLLEVIGEAAVLANADAKTVLQQFFQPGEQPTSPVHDAFLAAGKLALDKYDYAASGRAFDKGLAAFPADADMLWGLAASFRESDRDKFADYAQQALASNPNHIPTLLMLAENLIDAESYDDARSVLTDKVLKINPHEPEALALLAAIALLHNQNSQAADFRQQALASWKNNPQVDYLIGRKLSQNYRFTPGAEAQTRALQMAPDFNPARVQLAQDLLRLGMEDEGWDLAAQASKADPYNVESHNLVELHDEISTYTTLATPHFNVRMSPDEAAVYGPHVLDLLERARTTLTAKYGLNLNFPVLIEIFPNPKDFSVRTFGMPDIGEFLGVTFGPVVTLNSPGSHDSNWEDVAWHEFMHVVSLTMTHNRMPRWLSEGISVYEEHQASPAWGMIMSPDGCERILEGKMQPISNMSAAFLEAKDQTDTQFAYFESMLVVQYLIEHYGFDHLQALLRALGDGEQMNDALASHIAPLAQLDSDFAQYAQDAAKKFGSGFSFTHPAAAADPSLPVDPRNFYARLGQIEDLMDQEKWTEARDQLKDMTATGLYFAGPENPYQLLAHVSAKLNDTAAEKIALTTVAEHNADSLEAVSRLLEIAQDEKNWPAVAHWGEAWVEIHPMAAVAWRALLTSNEQLGNKTAAIEAGQALLQLDPPDIASIHYRLGRLMQDTDTEGARRQVLEALEEAPRFRAAYDLLTALPPAPGTTTSPATP